MCFSDKAGRMKGFGSKGPCSASLSTIFLPAKSGPQTHSSTTGKSPSPTTWLHPTSCWGWRTTARCSTPCGEYLQLPGDGTAQRAHRAQGSRARSAHEAGTKQQRWGCQQCLARGAARGPCRRLSYPWGILQLNGYKYCFVCVSTCTFAIVFAFSPVRTDVHADYFPELQ